MAYCEHLQPPTPFGDLLHIRRETTPGISGLIHIKPTELWAALTHYMLWAALTHYMLHEHVLLTHVCMYMHPL